MGFPVKPEGCAGLAANVPVPAADSLCLSVIASVVPVSLSVWIPLSEGTYD